MVEIQATLRTGGGDESTDAANEVMARYLGDVEFGGVGPTVDRWPILRLQCCDAFFEVVDRPLELGDARCELHHLGFGAATKIADSGWRWEASRLHAVDVVATVECGGDVAIWLVLPQRLVFNCFRRPARIAREVNLSACAQAKVDIRFFAGRTRPGRRCSHRPLSRRMSAMRTLARRGVLL